MKALPSRFSDEWHDSEITNKDGSPCGVRFCIRPLTNRIRSHIQTASTTYSKADGEWKQNIDGGGASYETVGFGLVALEGLTEPGTDLAFILVKETIKMGAQRLERIVDACLDRIPPFLYREIEATINLASLATTEEVENANFTLISSPEPTSTTADPATEMSEPVPTDASADSASTDGS